MWREAVDQWPRIRRLADGAIDYDHYRNRVRLLRSTAIENFFKLKRRDGPGTALTWLARVRAAWKS